VLFSSHQLDLVEHLCEDVVIIDHGRVVLTGDLDQIRDARPDRFVEVRYRGPAPDWSSLEGATLLHQEDGFARLSVRHDADLARLAASLEDGREVRSFDYQPPTLSELFRQAVAA
jgi:ABC-2 type transport system ATP-binding protein